MGGRPFERAPVVMIGFVNIRKGMLRHHSRGEGSGSKWSGRSRADNFKWVVEQWSLLK